MFFAGNRTKIAKLVMYLLKYGNNMFAHMKLTVFKLCFANYL